MTLKLTINPMTGLWNAYEKKAKDAEQAAKIVQEFNCDVSVQVGDIVHQDINDATIVITSVTNTNQQVSIGVVISKPSATTCRVLILGIQDGFSGLTIGTRVYLGISGGITETAPNVGYQQVLGTAVATDTVFFVPNNTRVFKS